MKSNTEGMFPKSIKIQKFSDVEIEKIKGMNNEELLDAEIKRLRKLKEDENLVDKALDIIAADNCYFCIKYRKDTTTRSYYKNNEKRIDGPGAYLNTECSSKCPVYQHYKISCTMVQERANIRKDIFTAIGKNADIWLKDIIDKEIEFLERIKNE